MTTKIAGGVLNKIYGYTYKWKKTLIETNDNIQVHTFLFNFVTSKDISILEFDYIMATVYLSSLHCGLSFYAHQ